MIVLMKAHGIVPSQAMPGYDEYVELRTFSFGMGRGVSMSAIDADRKITGTSLSEISLTRSLDHNTPELASGLLVKTFGEYIFKFLNSKPNNKGEYEEVLEIKVGNGLLSSYSIQSSDSESYESFSVSYTQINLKSSGSDRIMNHDISKKGPLDLV